MPVTSTVFLWLSKHPDFSEQYARAQSDRAAFLAEEILEISDDSTGDFIDLGEGKIAPNAVSVSRDKLKVDTRKWLMSKMAPKKYGDKLELGGDPSNPINVVTEVRRVIVDPKP
jgi:hypothetical protein